MHVSDLLPNPWITEQMLDDTLWWIREYDLDGLRIDAVKHMHRVMTVNLKHRIRDELERVGGPEGGVSGPKI